MNLRNALSGLLVLGLPLGLAVGQEGESSSTRPIAVSGTAPDLRIFFTGYLLGYYRLPQQQTADFQKACPTDAEPGAPSTQLIELLKKGMEDRDGLLLIEDPRKKGDILLGMGDNFGVELYSRTYLEGDSLHPKPRNSQDPQWATVPASRSIGDNVGCFLSLAGYDALVPGKEDFYFGPERLRRIARRLAAVLEDPNCKTGCFHPVHMLGANLVVQTSYVNEPTKVPDSAKGLKFMPGLPSGIATAEISDHGTVLPFLRKIAVRAAELPEPLPLRLCPAPLGRSDEISCSFPILLETPVGEMTPPDADGKVESIPPDIDGKVTWSYALPEDFYLQAGGNYGLCTVPKTGETITNCIRFNVAVPYFQSCPLGDCMPNQYDSPYVFLQGRGKGVVIYGVVDQDLKSLVGRDNLSWENKDRSLKTEVTALDPLKSLQQSMQVFEKDHPGLRPRKVLLAQMSRAKAEELAENLDFDVVIAAAKPYEHATTNRKLTLDPKPTGAAGAKYRGVVLIPWQGIRSSLDKCRLSDSACKDTKNSTLFNPLRQVDLWDDVSTAEVARRHVKLSGERFAINHDEKWTPKQELDAVAGGCVGWKQPANDAFVNCTLKTLRDKTHADVALMQKRDFYFGPFQQPPSDATKNALGIERVLWTGDILQVVTVTGDTLKKVLKESDLFDQQDIQATLEKTETKRGFYTFGIRKTEDEQYLIDGDLLDPKRLYTVATTNHITAGDTGYPELNDPQLAEKKLPNPPEAGGVEGKRISELVCYELVQKGCVKDLTAQYPRGDGNSLFPPRADRPPENKPGLEVRAQAWLTHSLDQPLIPKPRIPAERDEKLELETKTENRPIWRFSLIQASFGFQESINNLSEKQRALLFTGFSAPGISGANSHKWQITKKAELVRSGKSWDEYVRNQLDYSSQVNEQIAPALPSISRDKNRDQLDAGFFYHPFTACHHFLPCPAPRKEFPKFGFVFEPFRFDSPVAQEELIIGPKNNQQKVNMGRAQGFLARAGLRFENANSHFEMGYEAGWERGALVTFLAGSTSCPPLPNQSPYGCLTSLTPPVNVEQIREVRRRRGFYVDHAWTTPLPFHNWQNVIQTQGEWFPFGPSNDNSSDTRKIFDITEKLSIPIFSSLSFQPGGEYFFYRNKFGISTLKRWTPSATLSWTFNWYSGGKLGKSISWSPNVASTNQTK